MQEIFSSSPQGLSVTIGAEPVDLTVAGVYVHNGLEEIKSYVNDISITPLSIPMLCGPGAIANGIILMSDATTLELKATLFSMIAVVYVLSYIVLRLSTRLVNLIGETGNNVMMRLMGLILMVIAVECFVGGLKPILIDIIQMSR